MGFKEELRRATIRIEGIERGKAVWDNFCKKNDDSIIAILKNEYYNSSFVTYETIAEKIIKEYGTNDDVEILKKLEYIRSQYTDESVMNPELAEAIKFLIDTYEKNGYKMDFNKSPTNNKSNSFVVIGLFIIAFFNICILFVLIF